MCVYREIIIYTNYFTLTAKYIHIAGISKYEQDDLSPNTAVIVTFTLTNDTEEYMDMKLELACIIKMINSLAR